MEQPRTMRRATGAGQQSDWPSAAVKEERSVEYLLDWAYSMQQAEALMNKASAIGPGGGGSVWDTMADYGCLPQGSRAVMSDIDPDAERIVDTVNVLAQKGEAGKLVRQYARSGTQPDAMVGVIPRYGPVMIDPDQGDRPIDPARLVWVQPHPNRTAKLMLRDDLGRAMGRAKLHRITDKESRQVVATVIAWVVDPLEIHYARQRWITWRTGLIDLRAALSGKLDRFIATGPKAPAAPWKKKKMG